MYYLFKTDNCAACIAAEHFLKDANIKYVSIFLVPKITNRGARTEMLIDLFKDNYPTVRAMPALFAMTPPGQTLEYLGGLDYIKSIK